MLTWNSERLLVFFLAVLNTVKAGNIPYYQDLDNSLTDSEPGRGLLTCRCGSSNEVVENVLDVDFTEKIFKMNQLSGENILEYLKEYSFGREYAKHCDWCRITSTKCVGDSDSFDDFFCEKKSAEFFISKKDQSKRNITNIVKRSAEMFPRVVEIPLGLRNTSRPIRQVQESCAYPTSLQTAAISCRIYPSNVKCMQRCAFGYTLENGIEAMLQCKYKENKWTPSGFKECQPFVDCTMALVTGGKAKCTTPSLLKGPECTVECMHYEDKSATDQSVHSCSIDGAWDPPFPFCAAPGTGLVLAKVPAKKFHDE